MISATGPDAADRRPSADPAALEAALCAAFARRPQRIERTAHGVSAVVYRVVVERRTFYARLAEEEGDDLAIDARVLTELRARGVSVPEVVHVNPFDAGLRRSLLITSALAGGPLDAIALAGDAGAIVREAGRDLALIHQLPIDGFGFVRRDRPSWPAAGELASYEAFVRSGLPDPWPGPLAATFTAAALGRLAEIVERERRRSLPHATFAHGDVDLGHIFSLDGRYTGLIDFGEIRGAEPTFDLGVFLFEYADTEHEPLLGSMVEGYRTVAPIESDEGAVARSAIMHGLRHLTRWTAPGFALRRPVRDVSRRVAQLLDRV